MRDRRAGSTACLLGLLISVPAWAQGVSVYSEFTRIDPFGQPVRADRGPQPPREILSPAIPRNAISSFHVVVEGRPGQAFTIQIAQNPQNAVQTTAWRERYTKVGGEWVPDALEPITLPFDGRLGLPEIPGQTAQAFWVDLMADRNSAVRRIKVEPQVYIEETWIPYPMEVRIAQTVLGGGLTPRVAGADDVSLPSSVSALSGWVQTLCADQKKQVETTLTIRNLIARNASQDGRLAGKLAPPELLRLAGVSDQPALCRGSNRQSRAAAEEYLSVRDAVVGAHH